MCALTCGAFTDAGLHRMTLPNPLRSSRRFAWADGLTTSRSFRRKESRVGEECGEAEESGNLNLTPYDGRTL